MIADPRKLGAVIALAALILDQAVKHLLLDLYGFSAMGPGEGVRVTSFFNLVMVWNKGVSFGLFPAGSLSARLFLLGFSSLVVAALCIWLFRVKDRLLASGIGLVVGGAIGNMIDRVRFGAVADFFHFHAFGYDWYVFNVADAAIVLGVAILLYDSFFGRERPRQGMGS